MDWSHLAGIDYIILAVIAVSILTGLFRGFIKELMALGVWAMAIWLAAHFCKSAGHFLSPWIHQTEFRSLTAFVVLLIAVLLLGGLLTNFIAYIVSRSGLSSTDRLLGMIFGWIRGVLMVSLLIVVMQLAGFPTEDYAKDSKFYKQFTPVVRWMGTYAPQILSKMKDFDPNPQKMVFKEEA